MSAFLQTSFDEMKTDKDSILFRLKIAKVSFFFALGLGLLTAACGLDLLDFSHQNCQQASAVLVLVPDCHVHRW